MTQELSRETLAEFIGTFMLVFVGAGAVVASGGGVIGAALAHGLVLVAIIATFGHISGAHVNPAVTLGLLLGGHMEMRRAYFYWAAQFLGATLAAAILTIVLPNPGSLGQTTPAPSVNTLDIILVEGLLTFFLVGLVYQAAAYGKGGMAAPLLIGLSLAGFIVFGGNLTGASLNPARTLGPAIVAALDGNGREIGEIITYLAATFAGGALAGFIHMDSFKPEEQEVATGARRRRPR